MAAPHAPIVLLDGERDALAPLSKSERCRDATASTLVELADVDHFALIDPSSAAWPAVLNALWTLARG